MSLIVETLEPRHLAEWGVEIEVEPFVGFAVRQGGVLTSLAMISWVEAPLNLALPAGWWAWFDSRGPVSPLAHRYALKIRDTLQAAGAEEVHAFMDADIPRAEAWMKRLGFVPWHQDVWRLSLVVDREGRRAGGLGQCGQGAWQAAEGAG